MTVDEKQVARMSAAFGSDLSAGQRRVGDGGRVPDLRLLASGGEAIMSALADFEQRTRKSLWSMQVRIPFQAAGALSDELDERSRRRGVVMRLVTPQSAIRANPLLSSLHPNAHRGPVSFPLMVLDDAVAIVGGPRSPTGDHTAWVVSGGALLDRALELWEATWAVSEPWVPPGEEPPLTERQVLVARLLACGAVDAAIMRDVGVSRRTLSNDVAVILEYLGASSRFEAGLKLTSAAAV